MDENYFTIGIIDAGQNLDSELEFEKDRTVAEIIKVKEETGTLNQDYKNAEHLILDFGESLFKGNGEFSNPLKNIVFNLIVVTNPPWKSLLRHGIDLFYSYINELPEGGNIIQVFSYAGLDDLSEESIKWWKLISNYSSIEESNSKEKLGLEGEILTIKYEKAYLKSMGIQKAPEHIAPKDPSAGFDVLSWRRDDANNIISIQIESKMSAVSPARFYLTRNEFEVSKKNQDTYQVYLWNKGDTHLNTPAILNTEWLVNNTPEDHGYGEWKEVLITPE